VLARGAVFFLEGFGQTVGGSNICTLHLGIPKEPVFVLESDFDGGLLVEKLDLFTAWMAGAQVYRTGSYALNGVPFANWRAGYPALLNARDGGINGVNYTGRRNTVIYPYEADQTFPRSKAQESATAYAQ